MEEVDAILISQLREIGCDLDEDVHGIAGLDSVQVMQCVSECLTRILVNSSEVQYLPKAKMISASMNMSVKYKYATQLSTSIQDLGYKSDIGYQTFMYGNEHEIRRLLLFLIERIPRDDEKTSDSRDDQLSSSSILHKLKNMNFSTIWIPYSSSDDILDDVSSDELKYNAQSDLYDHYNSKCPSTNVVHTASNLGFRVSSFLLKSHSKALQRYAKHKLSNIADCQRNPLLPQSAMDILEWNSHFCRNTHFYEEDGHLSADLYDTYISRCKANNKNPIVCFGNRTHILSYDSTNEIANIPLQTNEFVNKTLNGNTDEHSATKELSKEELYSQALDKLRTHIREYDQEIEIFKAKENELAKCENEYQEKCKLFEASYKSKDELQNGIAKIKSQIEEISATWEGIQKDLFSELKLKKSQSVAQNEEYRDQLKKITQLKKSIASKLKEIQSKEALVTELSSKTPQQWPPNRASYTRRIIEIIGNVKKQNEETKKVLMETKTIQKDINNLNGKIERSFAVSEDVIYREAKLNDWNRKCYKSLALLQTTFDQLLEAVSNVGVHLREIRQLEEMVDNERARKASSNLARINADLQQIKLENEQLKIKISE